MGFARALFKILGNILNKLMKLPSSKRTMKFVMYFFFHVIKVVAQMHDYMKRKWPGLNIIHNMEYV
jgi:hypothetical protein